MGLPVARMSDTGFGEDLGGGHDPKPDRTGVIIGGSANVVSNGLPVARMSDIVIRGDGHSGVIIGGSANVVANGLPVARMSDTFIGDFTGIIISGSSNVIAGG